MEGCNWVVCIDNGSGGSYITHYKNHNDWATDTDINNAKMMYEIDAERIKNKLIDERYYACVIKYEK